MTERLFPLQSVSDQDARLTFGLLMDIADVLARHDYPSIRETASGADLVALRQALFGFLYGEPARVEDSRVRARYVCPTPDTCGFCHDPADHADYARHRGHDGTGRDDCPYCPTVAEIAEWTADESTADEAPHTVPCVWGCGHLAESEAELEAHELECEHEHENGSVLTMPAPRPGRVDQQEGGPAMKTTMVLVLLLVLVAVARSGHPGRHSATTVTASPSTVTSSARPTGAGSATVTGTEYERDPDDPATGTHYADCRSADGTEYRVVVPADLEYRLSEGQPCPAGSHVPTARQANPALYNEISSALNAPMPYHGGDLYGPCGEWEGADPADATAMRSAYAQCMTSQGGGR